MKFNRKVAIVPYEKVVSQPDSTVSEQTTSAPETNNTSQDDVDITKQTKNQISGSTDTPINQSGSLGDDVATLVNFLSSLFTSKQRLENALGIALIMKLDPAGREKDKDLLLYTQYKNSPPPGNPVDIYHALYAADIPLRLISNSRLRDAIRQLKLSAYESTDDEFDFQQSDIDDGDVNAIASHPPVTKKPRLGDQEQQKKPATLTLKKKRKIKEKKKKNDGWIRLF